MTPTTDVTISRDPPQAAPGLREISRDPPQAGPGLREISRQALAEHLLRVIVRDHLGGKRSDLDSLCATIALRRADVRATLSDLDREGFLDVLRMRLSLAGFALGLSLLDKPLRAVRTRQRDSIAA